MIIDTSQPIMFDTDTMPGKGAGTWQLHPHMGDNRPSGGDNATDKVSKVARMTVAALIGGGLIAAAVNTILL